MRPRRDRTGKMFLVFLLGVFLAMISAGPGFADNRDGRKKEQKTRKEKVIEIKKAVWKNNRLKIKGKSGKVSTAVTISNADSGQVVALTTTDSKGRWEVKIKDLAQPPCRVRARIADGYAEKDVKGGQKVCSSTGSGNTGSGNTGSGNTGSTGNTGNTGSGNTGNTGSNQVPGNYKVLAFNDLGMHCYDNDFSVFSILPPFNVIHAQVVKQGQNPEILDDSQVDVYYKSVQDPQGSINTTSEGKTNFWDYVLDLFGVVPLVDEGLTGNRMPGSGNTPQPLAAFDPDKKWFTGSGVPITATDDQGRKNHYPLMRIEAYEKSTGTLLAFTDIVLPVSDEMHCGSCHATGGRAADQATAAKYGIANWSSSTDPEVSYRENILLMHDADQGTDLMNSQPVLCASCHYSPALDLAETGPTAAQAGNSLLSEVIHGRHGKTVDGMIPSGNQQAIIPENGTTSCYSCHPGSSTKCLRGAMGSAGINCQDCHGGLLAVSGEYASRTPWLDEPKCQSCHTGDALQNDGSIRMNQTYDPTDPAASPRLATNKRFAENDNTLFRNSNGHGGIACESCHGSTHAIWPSSEANDNLASVMLQGHDGTIIECSTCHADQLPLTTDGPHGMHNVGDQRWLDGHKKFYEADPDNCRSCHGQNLQGTVLSEVKADRNLKSKKGQVFLPKGTAVGCNLCHGTP